MADYISISDITNSLFSRITSSDTKQIYVDLANAEAESFAQSLGVMDATFLVDPICSVFKAYLVQYALYNFAGDYIGVNVTDVGEGDVYRQLFDRSLFLINRYKPEITYAMLTGTVMNRSDRAVSFGKQVRS